MNQIAGQRCLRIRKRDARGFTAAHNAMLDVHVLDLLTEDKAIDFEVLEDHPFTVKNTDAQSAVLLNGQSSDFHVPGPIRPFSNMQRAHPLQARDQDFFPAFPNDREPFFTVDRDVLDIAPCLDEDGIPILRLIDGLLNGREVPGPVQGHVPG